MLGTREAVRSGECGLEFRACAVALSGSGRGVDLIVYGTLIVLISLARPEGLVGLFSPRRKETAR